MDYTQNRGQISPFGGQSGRWKEGSGSGVHKRTGKFTAVWNTGLGFPRE